MYPLHSTVNQRALGCMRQFIQVEDVSISLLTSNHLGFHCEGTVLIRLGKTDFPGDRLLPQGGVFFLR